GGRRRAGTSESCRRSSRPRGARSARRAWPAGARVTRAPRASRSRAVASEEAERVGVVGDQQALGLAVVVEHHAVVLAADAGVLVAAERGVGGVEVVAVGPHAAGLDAAAHAERAAGVACPYAGA